MTGLYSSDTAGPVRIVPTQSCRLTVDPTARWPFAERHAAAIDAHWQTRTAESAALFNGRIFVMDGVACDAARLQGRLIPIEFKSFLYWRETGESDRTVYDAFGSALIRARCGAVLLGRQRAGNINAGLTYLPGGFIDPRDVGDNGLVDVTGSVLREVAEETGLPARLVTVRPGHLITFCGQQVSVAVEVAVNLGADEMLERVRAHLAAETDPELDDVVLVSSGRDLEGLAMPNYARGLLENLFASA